MTIIDVEKINSLLEVSGDEQKVENILAKALELKGLELDEIAVLLNLQDNKLIEKMYKTAKQVKERIYGKRIVFFAPLYLSNYCCNNCLYCGFRQDNKTMERKKLTVDEAVAEAEKIMEMGHKRILLVAGEDVQKCNLDYIKEIIDKIYEKKVMNGEVRRLNINIAPLKTEQYERLSTFGIGTIQVFQETYHPDVYKQMHLSGPKANYQWRLEVMDRAIEGGIKDFGMGALFGLCDYRFEVLALISHSKYLMEKYGVGPHTLSVPRIEPASGSDVSENPPHAITDEQFKKIISILRLAVPYTGMILTTRENAQMRRDALELGITQLSAGSKTNPGGYCEDDSTPQFTMSDSRTLDEMAGELSKSGYIPSFCTSCYRLGRVGKDFMDLAQVGLIQKFCDPNAVSTFAEYLEDYASPETKKSGYEAIYKHLDTISDESVKLKLNQTLDEIKKGKRDLFV